MSPKEPDRRGGVLEAGARVLLRHPRPRDREEFLALTRASARLHRGLVAPPTDSEGFAEYVARRRWTNYVGFLVCRMGDGRIVGAVSLSEIVRGNFQSAYMGYYVGAPYARRGYMADAIQLALRHAFDTLRLHRVEANIQPQNAASIALAERSGFVWEGYSRRHLKVAGRWRDHERWAILAEDWRAERTLTTPAGAKDL